MKKLLLIPIMLCGFVWSQNAQAQHLKFVDYTISQEGKLTFTYQQLSDAPKHLDAKLYVIQPSDTLALPAMGFSGDIGNISQQAENHFSYQLPRSFRRIPMHSYILSINLEISGKTKKADSVVHKSRFIIQPEFVSKATEQSLFLRAETIFVEYFDLTPIDTTESASSDAPVTYPFPMLTDDLSKQLYANLRYPEKAQRKGKEGDILVQLMVNELGSPEQISVINSLGHGLDEATIEAVRKLRFEPFESSAGPTKIRMTFPVRFRLDE